jgi:hypothetical protein
MPDGPDLLNLETLYWHVRKELVGKRRPTPQQRAGNDGGMIVLARNRRGAQARTTTGVPARPAPRPLPEPPAGFEYLMRRSPREIASEAARLATADRVAEARQLLAAAAARRPDQEVAALIAMLRQDGRDGDAEFVIGATRERPAAEIVVLVELLRQFASEQDAVRVLDAVAHATPEAVGATADILATSGRAGELRHLLDAAILAHQRPEDVIALVAALSSIGLGQEVGRLLDLAADGLTDTETAALGDALRGAGRDDAAFRLYAAARRSIARRPGKDIASLLRAMRDSGQDDDASDLMAEICTTGREPDGLLELASALWSAALDADAGRLLDSAAATLTAGQVIELAASLRDADRYEAALRLCVAAGAQHPVAVTVALVVTLRDAGRPADAQRVLDSSLSWPPGKAAELAVALDAARAHADADRILASAARSAPGPLALFMAALRDHGLRPGAGRLAELAPVDVPADVGALIAELVRQDLGAEAERLLIRATAGPAEYQSELIMALRQDGLEQGIDYLINWQAQQEVGEVLGHLAALHQRGLSQDEWNLLNRFSERPVSDIVALAELSSSSSTAETDILARSIAQRPLPEVLFVLETARRNPLLNVTPVLSALADGPPARMGPLLARLCADLPALAGELTQLIVSRMPPAKLCELIADMRSAGADQATDTLLTALAVHAGESALMALHSALGKSSQFVDADYLMEVALTVRPVSFMESLAGQLGGLYSLWHGKVRLSSVVRQITAQRSDADVRAFKAVLSRGGYRSEAWQLQLRRKGRRS